MVRTRAGFMQESATPSQQDTLVGQRPVPSYTDDQATVSNMLPASPGYLKSQQAAQTQTAQPSVPPMFSSRAAPPLRQTPGIGIPAVSTSSKPGEMIPPPPPVPLSRESIARDRSRRRRVQRKRGGEWAWVVIAIAMFAVVLLGSMSLFVVLRAAQAQPEVMATAAAVLPTPVDARGDGGVTGTTQELTLADGRSITLVPWDGTSRFTVLVVGLDRRPGETGLAYRTDTMMLVSIDPASRSLGILSIPRDLYVAVPGYSEPQRVNTPMVLGEIRQPGSGPQLLMQTVQYNLGIRVNDYIAVDFNTFVTLIDTIGGVELDVPYTINDPLFPDMNYGYDPFYITAGIHQMDGRTALKYARTRHGDSDFRRAQRQQAVIYAIRDKILELDMLPQLIIQAPTLWNQLSSGISTGLQFDQIIQLALYLKDIPLDSMKTGVINEQYTMGYTTSDGASVLVPDRANIGPLMVEVFGANYSQ
jgi:polyisoprenyl-teichoic acid--peptidoglycan teichoic acid transferase